MWLLLGGVRVSDGGEGFKWKQRRRRRSVMISIVEGGSDNNE